MVTFGKKKNYSFKHLEKSMTLLFFSLKVFCHAKMGSKLQHCSLQDEDQQTECKLCPSDTSTKEEGAADVRLCTNRCKVSITTVSRVRFNL